MQEIEKIFFLREVVVPGEFFRVNNFYYLDFARKKLRAKKIDVRRRRLKNLLFFFYLITGCILDIKKTLQC
jgi:hypothetical protein